MLTHVLILSFAMFSIQSSFAQDKPSTSPTDQEIMDIALTANRIEIDKARLARDKSYESGVLKLAKAVMIDHEAINKKIQELCSQLKVVPKTSDISNQMLHAAQEDKAKLFILRGNEFDHAYAVDTATLQQSILDRLDTVLIPNTHDSELKGILEKLRGEVVMHLNAAKRL